MCVCVCVFCLSLYRHTHIYNLCMGREPFYIHVCGELCRASSFTNHCPPPSNLQPLKSGPIKAECGPTRAMGNEAVKKNYNCASPPSLVLLMEGGHCQTTVCEEYWFHFPQEFPSSFLFIGNLSIFVPSALLCGCRGRSGVARDEALVKH